MLTDNVNNYLIKVSAHITSHSDLETMNQYYSAATEFERLGDHATNISEIAESLHSGHTGFSGKAKAELKALQEIIGSILDYSDKAFEEQDISAARHIEPLEEVVDDMVNAMKDNHLERLRNGECSILPGTEFLKLLSEVERISDICSNVGVAAIASATPEIQHQVHDYVSMLHSGRDEEFNREYREAHDKYFALISER